MESTNKKMPTTTDELKKHSIYKDLNVTYLQDPDIQNSLEDVPNKEIPIIEASSNYTLIGKTVHIQNHDHIIKAILNFSKENIDQSCVSSEKKTDQKTGINYIDVRKDATIGAKDFLIIEISRDLMSNPEKLKEFITNYKDVSNHGCNVLLYQINLASLDQKFTDINLCNLGIMEQKRGASGEFLKIDADEVLKNLGNLKNREFICYRINDIDIDYYIGKGLIKLSKYDLQEGVDPHDKFYATIKHIPKNDDNKDRLLLYRTGKGNSFTILDDSYKHIEELKEIATNLVQKSSQMENTNEDIKKKLIKENLIYLIEMNGRKNLDVLLIEYLNNNSDPKNNKTPEYEIISKQLELIKEGTKPEKPDLFKTNTIFIPKGSNPFLKQSSVPLFK